jgi:hypothetical protein
LNRPPQALATLLTVGGLAIAADPPAKEVRVKTITYCTTCRPVEGVVDKIDADGLTLVEVTKSGDVKEHHFPPIDLLRDGKVLPTLSGRFAYRWEDVKRGDTVVLEVKEDHIDKRTYCLEISIRRRPGDKLPESQNPEKDPGYLWLRIANDLENGTDVSDEDILKACPPGPERKDGSGRVTPAHPGGLPKEWQDKLDAIRAMKKDDPKAKPPEKKDEKK